MSRMRIKDDASLEAVALSARAKATRLKNQWLYAVRTIRDHGVKVGDGNLERRLRWERKADGLYRHHRDVETLAKHLYRLAGISWKEGE